MADFKYNLFQPWYLSVVSIIPRGHQYKASDYHASDYNASDYHASEGVVLSIPMNKFRRLPHERVKPRTTLPYTPKTNGMVERMNGLTKENDEWLDQRKHRQEEP